MTNLEGQPQNPSQSAEGSAEIPRPDVQTAEDSENNKDKILEDLKASGVEDIHIG